MLKSILLDEVVVFPNVGELCIKGRAASISTIEDIISFSLRGGLVEKGEGVHASKTASTNTVEACRGGAGGVV